MRLSAFAIVTGLIVVVTTQSACFAQDQALDGRTDALVSAIETRWGKPGDGRKAQNFTEALARICAHLIRTSDANGLAPAGVNRDLLAGQCIGFFEGQRYSYAYRTPDGRRLLGVCYPEQQNYFPLVKRFLEYALAHPEDHQHGPGLVAWWSALEGWPCGSGAPN